MDEKEREQLRKLLDDVFATEPDEIQCDRAGILMAKSTHQGLSDEESQEQYPMLWRHFRFCPDCAEEYQMLATLTERERAGELDRPKIPPIPNSSSPSLWTRLKDALTIQFPGFQPALATAVQRGGGSLEMEPVEVELDEDYTLSLDVMADEEKAAARHLYGTVLADDETLLAASEGAPAWLEGEEGGVRQEAVIDELGDFAFSHVQPGEYVIRLSLSGREYVVSGVTVP